jgi:hypothetical protein
LSIREDKLIKILTLKIGVFGVFKIIKNVRAVTLSLRHGGLTAVEKATTAMKYNVTAVRDF